MIKNIPITTILLWLIPFTALIVINFIVFNLQGGDLITDPGLSSGKFLLLAAITIFAPVIYISIHGFKKSIWLGLFNAIISLIVSSGAFLFGWATIGTLLGMTFI